MAQQTTIQQHHNNNTTTPQQHHNNNNNMSTQIEEECVNCYSADPRYHACTGIGEVRCEELVCQECWNLDYDNSRIKQQPKQLLDELVDTWHDWYDTDMVMDPNYPGVGDDTTWHPIEDNRHPIAKAFDLYIDEFCWMNNDYKPIDDKNALEVYDNQSYFIKYIFDWIREGGFL